MASKSHASMAWLTRTSCSRCPCRPTTFQENLTVSAASTPWGAVLFCWKPPATTWVQVTGASSSVPSCAKAWIVYGYEKLVLLQIPTLWKVYGYEKLVLLLIPTLWKVWGYEKLVLLQIPTLWKVYGYEKLVLLLIPTLWKVWGYEKLILLQIPKSWKTEGITRERYIPKCLLWAFCVLGLCRKNVLWDTKFAANNV